MCAATCEWDDVVQGWCLWVWDLLVLIGLLPTQMATVCISFEDPVTPYILYVGRLLPDPALVPGPVALLCAYCYSAFG